jgi:hypothetical protein
MPKNKIPPQKPGNCGLNSTFTQLYFVANANKVVFKLA